MSIEKINASKKALEFLENDSVVGLGTGTTIAEFLKLLGEKVRKENLKVVGVSTSFDTTILAMKEKIPLLHPEEVEYIDISFDGADVVENDHLIKGGGGALTREKIVDYAAKKFIVLADEGKLHRQGFKIPIEVIPFSTFFVLKSLKEMGGEPSIRMAHEKVGPTVTDNGNLLIDCKFNIKNPKKLESDINSIPGVVENGIFTKFSKVIIGTKEGARIL
jgi:ribose 5-phosphate isomerase A